MAENIDLTKDTQKLLEYTADEAEKELSAIEGHLAKIDQGSGNIVIVPFCMECVRKHAGLIIKLSDECLSGRCPVGNIWKEMKIWATKARERLTDMLKNENLMNEPEAKELVAQSRDFRKKMEKIALGDIKQNIQEYLI